MSRQTRGAPAATHRLARVAELVKHAAAETLSRGSVEIVCAKGHGITISRVSMSPDLRLATLFIAPIDGVASKTLVDELDKNKKALRTVIAQKVNLKFAAELRFLVDDAFEKTARVDALLSSSFVRRDLAADKDAEPQASDI